MTPSSKGASGVRLDAASTPETIEARSFALIESEIPEPRPFNGDAWQIAARLIHTTGDTSLIHALHLPEAAVKAGINALRSGAPVFTDTEMAKAGIPLRRLAPMGVKVSCLLDRPGLAEEAARLGATRSRAAVAAAGEALEGAVVAVGNAPTALLALLELFASGGPKPALVIGMPVGFVNAEESKELLVREKRLHSLAVRGRRGGSPLAVATVNALAILCAARG